MFSLAQLFGTSASVDLIVLKAQTGILHSWVDAQKSGGAEAFAKLADLLPKDIFLTPCHVRRVRFRLKVSDIVKRPDVTWHCVQMSRSQSSRSGVPAGNPAVCESTAAGLCHQVMLDLQKVSAMSLVSRDELAEEPWFRLTTKDRVWMRELTASVAYSSRFTLAVRQSQTMRKHGL